MGIKEYFIKEIYKDYFLCSLPFIAMIPIFVWQMICINEEGQDEVVLEMALLFYGIFLVLGIVLIITYVASYTKYKKMLSLFSKEELERINKEAETVFNMGKILITNDAVIFFGFFQKQVIPTKLIEDAKKVEGTIYNDGYATIDYKNIILECKNGEQVSVPAPKNYNNIECEFCKRIIKHIIENKNKEKYVDINSLKEASVFRNYKEFRVSNYMELIIAIPYLLLCLLINKVIKIAITNSSDYILKTFYSVSFEEFLGFIELVIFTITFAMLAIYFNFHNKHIVKGKTAAKTFKYLMLIALIFLSSIFMLTSSYESKKESRSDYISYLKHEYKTYTGKVLYSDAREYLGLSCTDYEVSYDGQEIDLYADDEVFFSTEKRIDKNKIYKITYLPKTHLIVDIKEENK